LSDVAKRGDGAKPDHFTLLGEAKNRLPQESLDAGAKWRSSTDSKGSVARVTTSIPAIVRRSRQATQSERASYKNADSPAIAQFIGNQFARSRSLREAPVTPASRIGDRLEVKRITDDDL